MSVVHIAYSGKFVASIPVFAIGNGTAPEAERHALQVAAREELIDETDVPGAVTVWIDDDQVYQIAERDGMHRVSSAPAGSGPISTHGEFVTRAFADVFLLEHLGFPRPN